MFDTTAYEMVRKKYFAEGEIRDAVFLTRIIIIVIAGAFPHLYDKTKPEIDVVAVGKAYINPLS